MAVTCQPGSLVWTVTPMGRFTDGGEYVSGPIGTVRSMICKICPFSEAANPNRIGCRILK